MKRFEKGVLFCHRVLTFHTYQLIKTCLQTCLIMLNLKTVVVSAYDPQTTRQAMEAMKLEDVGRSNVIMHTLEELKT